MGQQEAEGDAGGERDCRRNEAAGRDDDRKEEDALGADGSHSLECPEET
jgi:hypothetical protein